MAYKQPGKFVCYFFFIRQMSLVFVWRVTMVRVWPNRERLFSTYHSTESIQFCHVYSFSLYCVLLVGVAYFAFLSPPLYLDLLLLASFFRVALVRLKRSFCFIMCKSLGSTLCKRVYEIALALHNGSSFRVHSHEPSEYDSV